MVQRITASRIGISYFIERDGWKRGVKLKTGEKRWVKWLLMYGLFLLTGYTLYAVVFWLM